MAAGQDEPQWIVFGHDSAPELAAAVADSATLTRSRIRDLRVLSPVDHRAIARYFPELEEPLHRAFHDKGRRCGGYTLHRSLAAALLEAGNPSIRTRN